MDSSGNSGNIKAVILAAGRSTRTYPLTVTRPKPLLKVANRTIIEHNLDQLSGLVDEVAIIVGFKKEMIMEKLGMEYKGMKITYIIQKEQTGTGSALFQAKDFIEDRFIMLYGDDIYSSADLRAAISKKYCVLAKKVPDPQNFGVFETRGKYMKTIVEKPEEFVSDLANCGAFVLDRSVFDISLEKTERGEFEATDYLAGFAEKHDVEVVIVKDYWFPIVYPWSLLDANSHFLSLMKGRIEGVVEDGAVLKGEVVVGRGTVIKSGTYIEGPVLIGENCTIGPNTYIRPDTTIGNNCNIRAEMFDAIIFDDTTAKHDSYIGHSVLGYDVNIGAGTITSDYRHDGKNHITVVNGRKIDSGRRKLGSFMGDHVRTAIHTSIYPGRKIWPYTGTLPGQIVKKDLMDMGLKKSLKR